MGWGEGGGKHEGRAGKGEGMGRGLRGRRRGREGKGRGDGAGYRIVWVWKGGASLSHKHQVTHMRDGSSDQNLTPELDKMTGQFVPANSVLCRPDRPFAPCPPSQVGIVSGIFLVGLAYSAISPIITIACVVYFINSWVFWRYNLLYV